MIRQHKAVTIVYVLDNCLCGTSSFGNEQLKHSTQFSYINQSKEMDIHAYHHSEGIAWTLAR